MQYRDFKHALTTLFSSKMYLRILIQGLFFYDKTAGNLNAIFLYYFLRFHNIKNKKYITKILRHNSLDLNY